VKVLRVTKEEAGARADVLIARIYDRFSRSSLEGLFRKNLVKIEGKPLKAGYKLKENDKLQIDDSDIGKQPPMIELPIIYEDENVIVINKPAGVLTHSKGAFNDEASVATFIKPKLTDEFPDNNRAGIVHRLDRATSGVIVAAKNKDSLSFLQKQFSQRRTKKKYLAIVSGVPSENTARIDVPIERNPKNPQSFRAGSNGKTAQTDYQLLKEFTRGGKQYSLIELNPKTGRTHQLRVHMSYIGCPIVGDKVYKGEANEHMFLHAQQLEITLPGGIRKIFETPAPKYFNRFAGKIDE